MAIESLILTAACILSTLMAFPSGAFADTPKAPAANNDALQVAASASLSWLNLLDKGSYSESWDKASTLLKLTMNKGEWETLMNKVRKPLGSASSRQVLDQRTAKDPHGLPKGDYMVMFYKTTFARKSSAYELVTLFLEDGEWSVVTYQVN